MEMNERVAFAFIVGPDEPDMLRASILVTTAAEFGGAITASRFVAVFSADVPSQIRSMLNANGIEVVVASANDDHNAPGIRSPLFHIDGNWDLLVAMDVASVVAADFSGYLNPGAVAVRPAGRSPISLPVWRRLFAHFDQKLPSAHCVTISDYAPSIPYYDPSFMVVPRAFAVPLREAWRTYSLRLRREADYLSLGNRTVGDLESIALTLALHSEAIPVQMLPLELVFPTHEDVHPAFYPDEITPSLLIYGPRLDSKGLLEATAYAGPNRAIDRVNVLLSSKYGSEIVPAGDEQSVLRDASGRKTDGAPAPGRLSAEQETQPEGRLAGAKRHTLQSFLDFSEGGDYPDYPLEVFLEVSNVCDLKCAMCRDFSLLNPNRYETLRNQERGFIDKDAFAGAMDEVLEHALIVHCFGFGEPTIHPQFRELIDYLAPFEVAIDFFTNGMHLTEELCTFLVERKVSAITISFSGATKEDYENVYQGGVFEQVLGGIARLAETKRRLNSPIPNIVINSLSFQHHIDSLPQFVVLMASLGVNHIFVKQLNGQADNPVVSGHIAVNRPWVEGQKLEQAKALAKQLGIGLSAEQFEHSVVADEEEARQRKADFVMGGSDGDTSTPVEFVPITQFKAVAKTVKPKKPGERGAEQPTVFDAEASDRAALLGMAKPAKPVNHPCMEPFKTLYVRKNGRVKTCCFHDSLSPALGDVSRQSGLDIWRGPGYRLIRDGVVTGEYAAGCQTCLNIGYGPWSHFLNFVVGEYSHWYQQAFNGPFLSSELRERTINAAENAEIILRRQETTEERAAVQTAGAG
ncbi:MAG: radical SAM/SPASM domain-containing protein [Gammaproteobacteria bacterium]